MPESRALNATPGATLSDIERVYRKHYPEFVRVAAAIVGDVDSARDVVHDAFVSAIRSRSTFRRRGTVEGWAWVTVVNSARKQVRRRAYRDYEGLSGDVLDPRTAPGSPRLREIRAAVSKLPERQRLVLFLRYYTDLDYATIAQTLGIAQGTVGATLHQAHEALRRDLEEVLGDV